MNPQDPSEEIRSILQRYEQELGKKITFDVPEHFTGEHFSREYKIFRNEALGSSLTKYEEYCQLAGRLFKVKVKDKTYTSVQEALHRIHLHITPEDVFSFSVLVGFLFVFLAFIFGIISFFFAWQGSFTGFPLSVFLFPFLVLCCGLLAIPLLLRYPIRLATQWRLKASNQMVLCILYVIMYMRHTSNLEHALKFAGEHVGQPLALDLRKVFWDVETGTVLTLKESLDHYLEGWRDYNLAFVEAFHLIESSLYESQEARRSSLLDKALEVMLDGTYEDMLHYAQELKSPMTMLHMFGVILPVLGLVLFPMLSSFLRGLISWYHIAVLYNLMIPLMVYYFGLTLLEKRPTGYNEHTLEPSFRSSSLWKGFFVTLIFVLLGFLPFFLFYGGFQDFTIPFLGSKFLDFKCDDTQCIGPYGVGALLLSLLIPLGLGLGLGLYYSLKTKGLLAMKKRTLLLEKEFTGALFQLGTRVGDGIPVEMAFGTVATSLRGTPTGSFFSLVDLNIRKMGMDVKHAIFDPTRGAINSFPSALIESSMKVLVEASRKGPQVVSRSMLTVSEYVKRVHQVNERLKDLLSDILSSMKSQISFLTPLIAAIVVSVSSMITAVINTLARTRISWQLRGTY